jgi:hypothetical protein
LLSQIKPIIELKDKRSVFIFKHRVGVVVVCVYQEKITHWFIPELQTAIDIEIIGLRVKLYKSGPE